MHIKKLQQLLFCFLVVLLPSQLGLHFWPSWSYVFGTRVDYLSPTLHVTDVLILVILSLAIPSFVGYWKRKLSGKTVLVVILTGMFIAVNICFSVSPAVSVYKWAKFLEMGLLAAWIIKKGWLHLSGRVLTFLLGVAVLWSSVLAIWQFVIQRSVGGWWYFLGERTFNQLTPGIANAFFSGQLVLRPYGTFSHPNVLASFLGLTLLFLDAVFLREKHVKYQSSVLHWVFLRVVLILGHTALFLSLSRTVVSAYLLALFILVFWCVKKKHFLVVLAMLVIVGYLVIGQRLLAIRIETEPFWIRMEFLEATWKSFLAAPVFGNGLGVSPLAVKAQDISFALRNQPPHSVFLIILVETGLVGLFFSFIAIGKRLADFWKRFICFETLPIAMAVFILMTGSADHYWLTLQQGMLSLVVVSGMVLFASRG